MKDPLGRNEVVTVETALKLLAGQAVSTTDAVVCSIENACGLVSARDIISPEDLPGFNRSTMDGYAVNSVDTFGASDIAPVYLQVRGEVLMGQKPEIVIDRGHACHIPTGGMLPQGADSVVMYEYTNRIDSQMVEIMKAVSPGENVIMFNEDVAKGDIVLRGGHRLRPQDIGALAGLGMLTVVVHRKPAVAIISTGNEVVQVDRPLSPGEVRDVNSYNLGGMVSACHSLPIRKGVVKDDPDALRAAVEQALSEADMLLITGGSSVGTADYTARVINQLGTPGVLFHGVAMKPGKPVIGGVVEGKPVFGLPGHPAAVTVAFETFIEPLLIKISGEKSNPLIPTRRTLKALFGRNLSSGSGREDYVRVCLEQRNDKLWAVPVLGKSGLIRTLVQADGLVVIPLNKSGLYEGEEVEVRLFS